VFGDGRRLGLQAERMQQGMDKRQYISISSSRWESTEFEKSRIFPPEYFISGRQGMSVSAAALEPF